MGSALRSMSAEKFSGRAVTSGAQVEASAQNAHTLDLVGKPAGHGHQEKMGTGASHPERA